MRLVPVVRGARIDLPIRNWYRSAGTLPRRFARKGPSDLRILLVEDETLLLMTTAEMVQELKSEKPPPHRVRDRAYRFIAKKAKATSFRAKTEPATRIPLPPRSLRTQLESKSNAAADLGTIGQSTVVLSPIKRGTLQEQVAAATDVAERMTDAGGCSRRCRSRGRVGSRRGPGFE
jgi:hypothetical protein